jgi:hypothetical protein
MTITRRSVWPDGTVASAVFDEREEYRYLLTRDFVPETGLGSVTFIMLNPSTADALKNDPTITRCSNFAKAWGYSRLEVVNLFALRSTDPSRLKTAEDPTGGFTNDSHIVDSVRESEMTVLAWGAGGKLHGQGDRVLRLLERTLMRSGSVTSTCSRRLLEGWLHVLGLTKHGEPRHPLYLRHDAQPIRFEAAR